MPQLIFSLEADVFKNELEPALGRCWKERSFAPCRALGESLLPKVKKYHADYHGLAEPTLLEQAAAGLTFDRHTWRALVGEVLLLAAVEVPLLQIPVATLCCLLAGDAKELPRDQFQPIHRVLWGAHDIVLGGGFYRPHEAGCNRAPEMMALTAYLREVDTTTWQPETLSTMDEFADEDDRAEEIAFARQAWSGIVAVYERAATNEHMMVCERV